MSKAKKKRTKKYTGADAASRPTITRVQAVNRSPLSQWLYERRRLFKPIGTIAVVIFIVILVISGIVSLF